MCSVEPLRLLFQDNPLKPRDEMLRRVWTAIVQIACLYVLHDVFADCLKTSSVLTPRWYVTRTVDGLKVRTTVRSFHCLY